jgi:putative peptidoglycan lipid II flippase
VLLPDLAEYAKSKRWGIYNERLSSAINIIALLTIPVTFFLLSQGEGLIRLLFQNRSFDDVSVALTLSAFCFHMPGLFFIALNRILAPAFYAQSDSKSPTLAGIISFGVNITLASILVGPYRGGGVALALSIASAVNTCLLFVFLKRNPQIAVGAALKSALTYSIKMIVFSVLAVLPLPFLSPRIAAAFARHGRIISYGAPLAISAFIFAAIGITLLLISRDKQLYGVLRLLFRKHHTAA